MPGNHVLLETIELTQNASSVVFDNIPQTGYTDLKIIASARSTRAGAQEDGLGVRLNASTTGYTYKILGSSGGSTFQLNTAYEQTWVCNIPAVNTTASIFSASEVYITNYTDSTPKTYSTDSGAEHNGATGYLSIGQMTQSTAAPVTSLTLLAQNGNLLAGSTFSLYAIAAKNTTPAVAPKATGGNIVANDGTYWYHAFLTSGYFAPQTALTSCSIVVIAGGGGSGASGSSDKGSGGGGAGGLLTFNSQSLTTESYPVLVGAGGANGAWNGLMALPGNNGNNSKFGSLTTAIGGGGGGGGHAGGSAGFPWVGRDGGSGGGSVKNNIGGLGTAGQGNNGGAANGSSIDGGAGGGGAGGAGASLPNSTSYGSAGGSGYDLTSWATATSTGVSGFYAGGGGGGAYSGSGGTASAGGGAGGNSAAQGSLGVAGTGGGGGGTGGNAVGHKGNNGGSGIVIIRYPMA